MAAVGGAVYEIADGVFEVFGVVMADNLAEREGFGVMAVALVGLNPCFDVVFRRVVLWI